VETCITPASAPVEPAVMTRHRRKHSRSRPSGVIRRAIVRGTLPGGIGLVAWTVLWAEKGLTRGGGQQKKGAVIIRFAILAGTLAMPAAAKRKD
jgi:hypothetical protein